MSETEARQRIEDLLKVRLPDSIAGLRVHVERGVDAALFARFEIPERDLAPFLEEAGFKTVGSERLFFDLARGDDMNWWHPDQVEKYISSEYTQMKGSVQYACQVLASADGETRTVYLLIFTL